MNLEIFENEDYVSDLSVRMAHHNTAIEGNTLTQNETASILLNGIIPRKINEREFFEVKNYQKILPFLIRSLRENRACDGEFLKAAHAILLENLIYNAGKFKTTQNMIVGADFETTPPYQVSFVLKDQAQNLAFCLNLAKNDDEKLKAILQHHIRFKRVHPFSDGNGRVGRFAMFYLVLQNGLTPFTISKDSKNEYIHALRNESVEELFVLAKQMQEFELARMNKFVNCKI